ncbi:hypothetical protein KDD17_12140 [Sulfitobacter albidus]|uniref:Anti-sigma factor n=1 Tax=Sulfitobacter albidus TaxID=2829501 RepID=A0A975JCF2_9RHOB|nr:hypothetical protein [Sulfitobacter albidus]QUJ75701.1 hypothetical protein KDD17_12140 [Sulfitobacter albidus]
MTDSDRAFTDEELGAYIDGEADADLRAAIEAARLSDPALDARLAQLEGVGNALRGAYDFDALDPPAYIAATQAPTALPLRRLAVPVGLAAAFVLGMFVSPQPVTKPGWIDQVASYQALYVTQTLAQTPADNTQSIATLAGATQSLGVDLSPATTLAELDFKRAQMLGIGESPLVQMAYLDDAGVPFAFCITRVDGADRGVATSTSHALATASWVRDGIGYVIVGGDDEARAQQLAESLQTLL